MLEHGLPVIVNVEGGTPDAPLVIQDKFKPLIIKADERLPEYEKTSEEWPTRNNKEIVAQQFLDQLEIVSIHRPVKGKSIII